MAKKASVKDILKVLAKERGLEISDIERISGGGVTGRLEAGAGIVEAFSGAGKEKLLSIRKAFSKEGIREFSKSTLKSFFRGDNIFDAYVRGKITKTFKKDDEKEKQEKVQTENPESLKEGLMTDESSALLQILAENTMGLNLMARDVNVMRQNLQELVKLWSDKKKDGKKRAPSKTDIHFMSEEINRERLKNKVERMTSDEEDDIRSESRVERKKDIEFFAEQDAREAELEAARQKGPEKDGPTVVKEKEKEKESEKGFFGGLLDMLDNFLFLPFGKTFTRIFTNLGKKIIQSSKSIIGRIIKFFAGGIFNSIKLLFNPRNLLRLGSKAGVIGVIITAVYSIFTGIKRGFQTGSIVQGLVAFLGSVLDLITFGLVNENTLRSLFGMKKLEEIESESESKGADKKIPEEQIKKQAQTEQDYKKNISDVQKGLGQENLQRAPGESETDYRNRMIDLAKRTGNARFGKEEKVEDDVNKTASSALDNMASSIKPGLKTFGIPESMITKSPTANVDTAQSGKSALSGARDWLASDSIAQASKPMLNNVRDWLSSDSIWKSGKSALRNMKTIGSQSDMVNAVTGGAKSFGVPESMLSTNNPTNVSVNEPSSDAKTTPQLTTSPEASSGVAESIPTPQPTMSEQPSVQGPMMEPMVSDSPLSYKVTAKRPNIGFNEQVQINQVPISPKVDYLNSEQPNSGSSGPGFFEEVQRRQLSGLNNMSPSPKSSGTQNFFAKNIMSSETPILNEVTVNRPIKGFIQDVRERQEPILEEPSFKVPTGSTILNSSTEIAEKQRMESTPEEGGLINAPTTTNNMGKINPIRKQKADDVYDSDLIKKLTSS